jgi:hypothetical protein
LDIHIRKLRFGQHREAGGKADERAEGGEIKQAQQPHMRAFQHRELIANGGFGTGDIVHPNHAATVAASSSGTQMSGER